MQLPVTYHGRVLPGMGIGRKLGFPTANVAVATALDKESWGVYCCLVTVAGKPVPGVTHIGPSRVAGRSVPNFEVHLLGWSGDLVGREVSVDLVHKLRDTQTFADQSALAHQITADCAAARHYFKNHPSS